MSNWKGHLVTVLITVAAIAAFKKFLPQIGQYI